MGNPLGYMHPYANTPRGGQEPRVFAPDYWQPQDVNDGGATINRALAAGAARYPGGFTLDLGPVTYQLVTGIVFPAMDNIRIVGHGLGTVLQPVSGSTIDAISTLIPGVQGAAGFIRNYLSVEDMRIDMSLSAATVAGQGNGVHFYGVRYGQIRNVQVFASKNFAIVLDGDNTGPGNNFGYNTLIENCVFESCAAGIYVVANEANEIRANIFKSASANLAAAQPTFAPTINQGYHLYLTTGYQHIVGNVFGSLGTYTTEAISITSGSPCRIEGNRFDQVRNSAIHNTAGGHLIRGNTFSNCVTQGGNPVIKLGAGGSLIDSNIWDAGAPYTYCVQEANSYANNEIVNNQMQAGTAGVISLNAASTGPVTDHNIGYNPVGKLAAQPAVPGTGVAFTNNSGSDCSVYVTGGTVTGISVGGQATGLTTGHFRVAARQTITLAYSVAPTWVWYGD